MGRAVQFNLIPSLLFQDTSIDRLTPNFLVLRIQPSEGINFQFGAKIPGPTMQMGSI
ncbi:hypothetical protein [Tumidithrix elongata]|uniref:hypothetical protein n=1 Tax=Tumidithrix elongata TaxID=3088357 RepID=UPI0038CDADDB